MLVFRWHSEDRKSNVKKSNEKEYQTNEKNSTLHKMERHVFE